MTEKHKAISETFGEFAHKSCDDSLSASELKAELKEREEKAKPLTDSIEEMKEILGEWKSWAKSRAELPGCENPVPDGPLAKIKKELLEGSTEHIPEIYKMYGNVESTLGDFLKGVRVPLAKAQVQADLAVVKIKDKLSRATAETLEELETEFHAAIKASSEFLTGDEKEDAQRNQKHADAQDVFDAQKQKVEAEREKKRKLQQLEDDKVAKDQVVFDKYDSSKKGKLTAKDIIAFAKGEYNFVLSDKEATKIFRQVGGGKGVEVKKFKQCRSRVGAAHSTHRHKEKQAVELDAKGKDVVELNEKVDEKKTRIPDCEKLVTDLEGISEDCLDDSPFVTAQRAIDDLIREILEVSTSAKRQAMQIKSNAVEFNELRGKFNAVPTKCTELHNELKTIQNKRKLMHDKFKQKLTGLRSAHTTEVQDLIRALQRCEPLDLMSQIKKIDEKIAEPVFEIEPEQRQEWNNSVRFTLERAANAALIVTANKHLEDTDADVPELVGLCKDDFDGFLEKLGLLALKEKLPKIQNRAQGSLLNTLKYTYQYVQFHFSTNIFIFS